MTHTGLVTHGHSTKRMGGIKAPYFDGTQPCTQTDPEIFFPENTVDSRKVRKVVNAICSSCSFKEPCLEYAMSHPVYGTWGGYTEFERNKLGAKKRRY